MLLYWDSGKQTIWQKNRAERPAYKGRGTGECSWVDCRLIRESRVRGEKWQGMNQLRHRAEPDTVTLSVILSQHTHYNHLSKAPPSKRLHEVPWRHHGVLVRDKVVERIHYYKMETIWRDNKRVHLPKLAGRARMALIRKENKETKGNPEAAGEIQSVDTSVHGTTISFILHRD